MPAELHGKKRLLKILTDIVSGDKASVSQKLKAAKLMIEVWELSGTKPKIKPNSLLGIKK